jgi:biopolymer transport protein ExbB
MNHLFPSVLAAVSDLPLLAQASTPALFTSEVERASLWQVLHAGGWVMIPLGVLSVITLALGFAFALTLRKRSIVTSQYLETAEGLLRKGDALGLLAVSNRHGEAVARVVQRTLEFQARHPEADPRVLREVAETEGSAQANSLQNSVAWLADIGVLAPMLGLLGTVTGIIRAFGSLGKVTLSPARDAMLASGVSEALIATATGLVLGISAFALHGIFRNRAQRLISELEGASAHLIGVLTTARGARKDVTVL